MTFPKTFEVFRKVVFLRRKPLTIHLDIIEFMFYNFISFSGGLAIPRSIHPSQINGGRYEDQAEQCVCR